MSASPRRRRPKGARARDRDRRALPRADGGDRRPEHRRPAALARLEALAEEEWSRDATIERLRGLLEYGLRRFGAQRAGGDEDIEDRSLAYQRVMREILDAQRDTLVEMRNRGEISNEVMLRLERELDLEDSRLEI